MAVFWRVVSINKGNQKIEDLAADDSLSSRHIAAASGVGAHPQLSFWCGPARTTSCGGHDPKSSACVSDRDGQQLARGLRSGRNFVPRRKTCVYAGGGRTGTVCHF